MAPKRRIVHRHVVQRGSNKAALWASIAGGAVVLALIIALPLKIVRDAKHQRQQEALLASIPQLKAQADALLAEGKYADAKAAYQNAQGAIKGLDAPTHELAEPIATALKLPEIVYGSQANFVKFEGRWVTKDAKATIERMRFETAQKAKGLVCVDGEWRKPWVVEVEIVSDEKTIGPLRYQYMLSIIVSGDVNRKSLTQALWKVHDQVAKRKGDGHPRYRYPNSIWIYAFQSQEYADGFAWLAMLAKAPADDTPKISFDDRRLKYLDAEPEVRHGLEEPKRRQVYREVSLAELIAAYKAEDKYRDDIDKEYAEKMRLIKSAHILVASKYDLTDDQLTGIVAEGALTKGWPSSHVSRKDYNKQRAAEMVAENSPARTTSYEVVQVVGSGLLCLRLRKLVFVHGRPRELVAEGDRLRTELYWAGTYSYMSVMDASKTVPRYALDRETAIALVTEQLNDQQ